MQALLAHDHSERELWLGTLGGVGCSSVLGVLVRERLMAWCASALAPSSATGQSGVVVTSIVPNIFGCFVLGVAVELRSRFMPKHPVLYTALTSGFCGCCTTFSSYNTAVVLLLLRSGSPGEGLLCALMALVLGSATAWCALQVGRSLVMQPTPIGHINQAYEKLAAAAIAGDADTVTAALQALTAAVELPVFPPPEPEGRPPHIRLQMIASWSLLLAFVLWVMVNLISDQISLTELPLALMMAPPGAWLRYQLGLQNKNYSFPLYTFLCNLVAALASVVLAGLTNASCSSSPQESAWPVVFLGLSTGFCGSLSTVSTLVDEVRRLGEREPTQAWAYGGATILGGAALGALVYTHQDCGN